MESLTTIVESLTKLEVFLLMVIAALLISYYFKLGMIDILNKRIQDLSIHNHNLYLMYMQLSNQSCDFVDKWQKCLDENKTLFEKLYQSSPK